MNRTRLSGEYHLALVSAFGATDFALSRGCRVAAINFSVEIRTTGWGRDRHKIEDVLLSYQGGGTVMPVHEITRLCADAQRPVLVLMITDAEVDNWDEMVAMTRHLTDRGHHLFLFHIGAADTGEQEEARVSLSRAGATVIPVRNVNDLVGLVLRDIHAIYRAP
ncbi:MAG: hypothetical protein K9W43_06325 [Candidatus Thorarchaeota archaeon]|nr:hypothetical protein [Candidatus Thorarchaeota archaeon]